MKKYMWGISVAMVVTGAAIVGFEDPPATADAGQHPGGERCRPSIHALPLPSGTINGDVLAVSGRRAAGFVADSAGVQHVAVWIRGEHRWRVRDLGDFGIETPGEPLSATGVDERGDVAVGISSDLFEGWLVTRSGTHPLHDFAGGTNAYVRAINDDGLMVGEALDASGDDFAAMWPHWWSLPVPLNPVAGYDGSYAQGVNGRGVVTGGSYSFGSLPTVATKWSPHGTPAALPAAADAEAMSLNARGTVVGRALVDPKTALVWNGSGDPVSLGLFADSSFARALSVNNHGDVVGFEGDNPSGQLPVRHVLFWPGQGPAMSLLPLSLNWADGALSHVIAPDGTVFGSSNVTHDSAPVPTMWRCASAQAFVPVAGGSPAGYPAAAVRGVTQQSTPAKSSP